MTEHEREKPHRGSFAEGEADPEEHPEDEHVGHFSEGQESAHSDEGHVGRFSEGEEELGEDDPEKHVKGRFSEGEE
jgi:hypothetical protein